MGGTPSTAPSNVDDVFAPPLRTDEGFAPPFRIVFAASLLLLLAIDTSVTRVPPRTPSPRAPTTPSAPDASDATAALKSTLLRVLHMQLNGIVEASGNRMGHTGDDPEQTQLLFAAVLRYGQRGGRFCEIGFNVGHSAATFLTASESSALVAFDYNDKPSVGEGFAFLRNAFRDVVFELVSGGSEMSVPSWVDAHPNITCDVIHIDGAHDGDTPRLDLTNMRRTARGDGRTLVVMDDCNCPTNWCIVPKIVFDKAIVEGSVLALPEGDSYLSSSGWRGSCLGWLVPGL